MPDKQLDDELIKKYSWAGKIRLISFSLLFVFLLMMKFVGGFSYLNPALCAVIFVGALLNQPYGFLLNKVNLRRFQYFQMLTDIIVISWVLYYMGGLEAPVVSLAYYAVILWAGVVSGFGAALFGVIACAFFLTSVVLLEQFGLLPRISFSDYSMPTTQVVTILMSNVAFLFAFGYFSVRSSEVIRLLQRKRQEESLRYTHRLQATGYLMSETAHDILECLGGIKAGVQVLQDMGGYSEQQKKFLTFVGNFEKKSTALVRRLAIFSKKPKKEYHPVDAHVLIEDALELTFPLVRYSHMSIEKTFDQSIPLIAADKDQMQEVFVGIILNALDAVSGKPKGGKLVIRTKFLEEAGLAEIIFSDTGSGLRPDELKRIGEPFFSAKEAEGGSGLGLATAYDIVARHGGRIAAKSKEGEGTAFTIQLPVVKSARAFDGSANQSKTNNV
jgi:signal transduction histidine kinase